MAPDFTTYLATQIIAEKQTVSYRNVARVLKVHVNAAKCMLYEFYEREKKKSAASVYATYLVAGTKAEASISINGKAEPDKESEVMASSPPPFTSSMLDPSQRSEKITAETSVPTKTITLVREEALEGVKKQYQIISSIHIYSVSPGRLPDLVVLTDIGRDLFVNHFSKEDPLKENKTYGVIQNPGVKRREGKRPKIIETPGPKFQAVKDEKKATTKDTKATTTTTTTTREASSRIGATTKEDSKPSSRDSSPAVQTTKPTLKKDTSNLFKAFAKQQEKPKLSRQDTDQSINASVSGAEDVEMTDVDDEGEGEDEALFLDTNTQTSGNKKRQSDVKKEREDKAAKLRKMMDSDDEENDSEKNVERSTATKVDPVVEKEQVKEEKADDVEWSDSDTEAKKQEPTEPRRRRGKRKVMKKRTMKDEDGYLVTKEEAVWESFSEDEPEPELTKDNVKSSFSSMKAMSQKSSAPAKGDGKKKGNIMSFFGKK